MELLVQVIMVLVALISAKEERYATYPYRMGIAPKTEQSKLYHRWGAVYTAISCITIGLLGLIWTSNFLLIGLIILSNFFIYWLIFDISFAVQIGRPWYYLGNESSIDRFLKRTLGVNEGGKTKAYIVGGLIIAINIVCIIFVR